MRVQTFTTASAFIHASAQMMLDACSTTAPSLALSGGKTPKPIYQYFAKKFLEQKTCVLSGYMVDERYLPLHDNASNWQMIQENLLVPATNHASSNTIHWHHFDTTLPPTEAAMAYEIIIQNMTQPFDLVVLGIGTDGHTASLFPQSDAVNEKHKLAVHVHIPSNPYPDRLTLTFPTILHAKQILLLASGPEKKAILEKLIKSNDSIETLPAKKLLEHPNLTIHYKS